MIKKFNNDLGLKNWFRGYYIGWLQACENQRSILNNNPPKYETVPIPFIPFGMMPALAFNDFLTRFIDDHLSIVTNGLATPYGNLANMLSVIKDPDDRTPYIMYEDVQGGSVVSFQMFRDKSLEQVKNEIKKQGKEIIYEKTAPTQFLRKVYELDRRWREDGDNARYLLNFLRIFVAAYNKDLISIELEPKLIRIVRQYFNNIALPQIDPDALINFLAPNLPNINIVGRRGNNFLDLGGKWTIAIKENAVFDVLSGLRASRTLGDFVNFLMAFAARGVRENLFWIERVKFFSKLLSRLLRRRLRNLPAKVQILTKVAANPLRMLLIYGKKAVVVTLVDGKLESVRVVAPNVVFQDPVKPHETSTKDIWLRYCKKERFCFLALRLKREVSPKSYWIRPFFDLGFLSRMDFFPENEFVKFALRKGPVKLLFDVLLPFLRA